MAVIPVKAVMEDSLNEGLTMGYLLRGAFEDGVVKQH